MRDFQRVIARENAAAGVYVTLDRQTARGARGAAAELGTIEVGARRCHGGQRFAHRIYCFGYRLARQRVFVASASAQTRTR